MIRAEAIQSIREKILSVPLLEVQKQVAINFYGMDKVVEALYVGTSTGKNIILYGPGGFGKSQVVKEFLRVVGVNAPTIVGYEDMEVEVLLGVPDIKKLTEHSVYELAFNRSVFRNPGILILEEFLDARPSTAAALKDVLTEGGLRQGGYFTESLISSVIICTNKSPDDMSIDDSSSAFYKERFPIRVKVVWSDYSHESYSNFLAIIKPEQVKEFPLLYDVLAEMASRTGSMVSPRMVKDASDLLDVHKTVSVLKWVEGLDTLDLSEILAYCSLVTERIKVGAILTKAKLWFTQLQSRSLTTVRTITGAIGEIDYITARLSGLSADHQENAVDVLTFIKECKNFDHSLRYKISADLDAESEQKLKSIFDDKSS